MSDPNDRNEIEQYNTGELDPDYSFDYPLENDPPDETDPVLLAARQVRADNVLLMQALRNVGVL